MAQDNSSSQLDDESHQTKGRSVSVHFNDEPENLPVPDWRNKKRKHRRITLAEKNVCDNTAAWRIDSREKLLTEMNKDPDGVLMMILDIRKTYTEYLDQANEVDNQRDKIRTRALGLEQELHISNKEREQVVSLL